MDESDTPFGGASVNESQEQILASYSLNQTGSSRTSTLPLHLPRRISKSPGMAGRLQLASQQARHRAVHSEPSTPLQIPASWESVIVQSASPLSKQRANELWNEENHQRLALLEHELTRKLSQIAELEEKLVSEGQKFKALKQIEEKRKTDYAYVLNQAKLDLTRGGWDMTNQLMLNERFDDKKRIAQLEKRISATTATMSKSEKQVGTLRSRIQVLKTANENLKLLAYRGVSGSEYYREVTIPAFLREWAVKLCLMRCVVALTAGRYVDAEKHSLNALNLSLCLHQADLTVECEYWRGVAFCRGVKSQDATASRQNAYSHFSTRGNEQCSVELKHPPAASRSGENKASFIFDDEDDNVSAAASGVSRNARADKIQSFLGETNAHNPPTNDFSINTDHSNANSRPSRSFEPASTALSWTTLPSLTADIDATSSGNESPELPIESPIYESINEVIHPFVADEWSSQIAPSISPADDIDTASSNPWLHVPPSFTARRYAMNNSIKSWRLQVPVQHRGALGALSNLPSGKRSALPRPTHENPPTPPTSFSPEEKSPMRLRRHNSWGDMRSMLRGLGQRRQIAEGEAARMVKMVKHSTTRKEQELEARS